MATSLPRFLALQSTLPVDVCDRALSAMLLPTLGLNNLILSFISLTGIDDSVLLVLMRFDGSLLFLCHVDFFYELFLHCFYLIVKTLL